jgi:putative PIN family toxin of toxin-antitoxin system
MRAWRDGAFELVVSPLLLDELQRAFGYPKVRKRISAVESHQFVRLLQGSSISAKDPVDPPERHSRDPGDDYLLALAAAERAVLVSQDHDLLSLSQDYPIRTPTEFLDLILPGR